MNEHAFLWMPFQIFKCELFEVCQKSSKDESGRNCSERAAEETFPAPEISEKIQKLRSRTALKIQNKIPTTHPPVLYLEATVGRVNSRISGKHISETTCA